MNVFEELLSKDIPYAVVVSKVRSARGKVDGMGREYFVVCMRKDIKGLSFRFKPSKTIEKLSEHSLRGAALRKFREEHEKYVLLIDDEDGRVYEQPGVSFRAYFKKHGPGG